MNLLEAYLRELREVRSFVREACYYPALANLLNRVGTILKPRVRCVVNAGPTLKASQESTRGVLG